MGLEPVATMNFRPICRVPPRNSFAFSAELPADNMAVLYNLQDPSLKART